MSKPRDANYHLERILQIVFHDETITKDERAEILESLHFLTKLIKRVKSSKD